MSTGTSTSASLSASTSTSASASTTASASASPGSVVGPLQASGAGAATVDPVVVAPVLVALTAAVLALLVPGRRPKQTVSVVGVVAYAVSVGLVVDRVLLPPDRLVYQFSGWPAPVGVVAVADPLSAFMLAVAAVVAVPALVYAVLHVSDDAQELTFHPLFQFMLVGVSGAFLTGDLFNLFVWFEVMLMASYVLVVFYSGPEHTRAGLQYVVLNLVASALMLVAVGGLYAATGTLNMADMARRLAAPAAYGVAVAPVLGASAVLFAVFALKTGLVPFQFWVPPAYGAAPTPVAAMLAGVVKKVGVYAIVRLYFTVFAAGSLPSALALPGLAGDSLLDFYGPVLFVVAAASVLLGGVGAVSRDRLEDVLSHSSIGQAGFIVLPLALAATASGAGLGPPFGDVATLGVAAALVYTVVHSIAKTALFLAAGTVEGTTGTTDLDDLGGLAAQSPTFGVAVFAAAVTLVGVPPLLGFFGKFLVLSTALEAGSAVALAVAVGGAVLTVAYVTRLWGRGFWGAAGPAVGSALPRSEVAVVVVLAAALVAVGVGFDPLLRAAESAASAALDTGAYVDSVAPRGPPVDGAGASASAEPSVGTGVEVGVGAGGGLPSTEVVDP
ncbi:Na+/H+ antiporter subunit D [Halobacteriales archaeon SW_12_71_31]|nr:MAG: Na+/H+ antiporter subunit D [Halobacteriales archaeon SW_12_71_31]